MNNKTIHKILFAALLMMAGCTNDEFMQQQPQTPSGEGIPFTAILSGKAATRAITENTTDKTLVTSWVVDEQVALIHNGVVDTMTVSKVGDDGAATITGTITGSPKDGDEVQVVYPASAVDPTTKEVKADLLASQDGTLATIASDLDLRMSSGTKLRIGPTTSTFDGTVSLANQIAIVKFSLNDGTEALAAKKFKIVDDSGNAITTVTSSINTDNFYVAMEPASNKTFNFTAAGNDNIMKYYYSKSGATLVAGKYYQSPIPMADISKEPLTFEATEDGTEITVVNDSEKTFQYAINGGDKETVNGTVSKVGLNAGDIVQFFSTNASLSSDQGDLVNITPNKKTYVYGNVMSMIDDARTDPNTPNFANDKIIGGDYALFGLLKNTDNTIFHNIKNLILPATTLSKSCYEQMFSKCTGLTTLPDGFLPATELKESCYNSMFSDCAGLTTVPKNFLPATTLADVCYCNMFNMEKVSSNLTTLPEDLLPATTLAKSCYASMFRGCKKLSNAPILPAPTLVDDCYMFIFQNCTKLSSVTCLATKISFYSLQGWLNGAGTAEGCERILYVNPAANFTETQWKLDTSGEEDKRWALYEAKPCEISELTTNHIGWRLGSDGKAYEPIGPLPNGVKAQAIIAYVGKVDKYFDHFLAIALEDVDNSNHTWAEALTKVGTYAENHSIKIGNTTYNTSTTPSSYYDKVADNREASSASRSATTLTLEQGWRLPSVTDWRYVFDGLGRIKGGLTLTAKSHDGNTTYSSDARPTNPLGIENGMYYYKKKEGVFPDQGNSLLRDAINTACGNTALQALNYWSSSEVTENSGNAWFYDFYNSKFWYGNKTKNYAVRAVFAY